MWKHIEVGPGALHRAAQAIDSLRRVDDTDTASDHAKGVAKQLLTEANNKTPYSVYPVSFDQFEHDLLIRWDLPGTQKGMMLVCPGVASQQPHIYTELVIDELAVDPKIVDHATADDIAFAMKWMLTPAVARVQPT
jgi:hypothetical protein